MAETLFVPFQFAFMQKAFVIMALLAVPMALLSCYLVLKGWSLMGDAIAHAILPGIVIAYLLHIPLAIGAFAAGLFCATSAGYLRENSRVKEDTILGIVFSGMFGLGIVLYLKVESDVHLNHILFGNMLGLSWGEIAQSGAIATIVAAFVLVHRHDLLVHAFDAQHARATGLPVKWLHYGLLAMISLAVIAALQAVGLILAIALLISPGAIAFLLTRRFAHMMLAAVIITLFSGFTGIYLSFFLDSAPAPTIVLAMTVLFIGAFIRTAVSRKDRLTPNS